MADAELDEMGAVSGETNDEMDDHPMDEILVSGIQTEFLPSRAPMGHLEAFKTVILSSKINVLLVFTPVAILSKLFGWGDGATFAFSMAALCPLAAMLGLVTEELASHTNQTLGGLLNATFGNATEVIISVFALKAGMLRIVQVSLLGSILSNMLLVLGCAFLVGGLRFNTQRFNTRAAGMASGMLLLSCMALLTPAALVATNSQHSGHSDESLLLLSRLTALLMFFVYIFYLIFQLKTHRYMFEEEDDEEGEETILSLVGALVYLGVLTVLIAVLSEYLVDSIEGVSEAWGISDTFIGVILIPIVGNAAEHASAVTVAYKNKMDLSLGVAIGSSIQIAVGCIPFMVLVAWVIGQPLSLYFQVFETTIVFASTLIVAVVLQDGESNWLEGLELIVCYVVIAIAFIAHK